MTEPEKGLPKPPPTPDVSKAYTDCERTIVLWIWWKLVVPSFGEEPSFPLDVELTNADIESAVPPWGRDKLHIYHTPGSFGRTFRYMRERTREVVYELPDSTISFYLNFVDISERYPKRKVKTFSAHFREGPKDDLVS